VGCSVGDAVDIALIISVMRLVPTSEEIRIAHTLLCHLFAYRLDEVVVDPIHKLVLLK
jgi:hypothetical protein